jgi:hypothetical protein
MALNGKRAPAAGTSVVNAALQEIQALQNG